MATLYNFFGGNTKVTQSIIKCFIQFCLNAMIFISLFVPLIACSENESHLNSTSKQSSASPSYQIKNGVLTDADGNKLAESGSADGVGATARFQNPNGLVSDKLGNLYVADTANHTIRKITPTGVVTTLAGKAGESGNEDGLVTNARFLGPKGIAIDTQGNLYIAGGISETIRKITPDGIVSTVAGTYQSAGITDGLGATARFDYPNGITIDAFGSLYVVAGNAVRKITPNGVVSTLAGNAVKRHLGSERAGHVDAQGTEARFEGLNGIVMDRSGNLYVTEGTNCTIRKISPDGLVTTLAGKVRSFGHADGKGDMARFDVPEGITIDHSGNLYVADSSNHVIRKVSPDGVVSTLAGSARNYGINDGVGAKARFILPTGMAIDVAGNLYVSDITGQTIRKITPVGVVSTLAGSHSDIMHTSK